MSQTVLVVEDESIVALDLQSRLTALGFSVVGIAKSGERALELVAETSPNVVLMDVQLTGEIDGIETARRIREAHPVPVIFLTAYSDQESIQRAKISEAYGYLLKPFQERELIIAIELALYKFDAEQRLRTNRLLLDATLNGIWEGVISTDEDNRIVLMNSSAETIIGISEEQARGALLDDVLVTDRVEESADIPDSWRIVQRPDGSRVPVDIQIHRIHESGAGPSAITVLRDISELWRYRRSLLESKNAAEAAARAKSVFLSKMSHELRTPLNGILGMAQLSLEEEIGEPLREYLEVLKQSAENLLQLVNDILVTTSTGTDDSQRERFSPVQLIETIVRSHAFEINRRGLRVALRTDPRIPANVSADPRTIGRMLEKLLSNAIKFTRQGHIEVCVRYIASRQEDDLDADGFFSVLRCKTGRSEPRLVLRVHDTGIGIPRDKIDDVFREYYQLDERVNREAEGAGLGLSIVARLAEQMGAGLSIRSEVERGSTVRVEIPIPTDERSTEMPEPGENDGNTVVVLTDDPLLVRSIEPRAAYLGAEVELVNGAQIIESLRANPGAVPETRLVLSRSGYEDLATALKEAPIGTESSVVLVDGFADRTSRSAIDSIRTIRYKEPLTAGTIQSIIRDGASGERLGGPIDDHDEADNLRSAIFEIVRGDDPVEAGRKLGELRDRTKEPELQEVLFRLSIAFKRADLEKAHTILRQLGYTARSNGEEQE